MNIIDDNSKVVEPNTYEKIIGGLIDTVHWKKAIRIELETLYMNNTQNFVNFFAKCKIIESKKIFKIKYDKYGRIIKNRTQLVAQGYAHQHSNNFNKTFLSTN